MKRILAWLMSALLALSCFSINPHPAIAASGNGWADKVVEFYDSGKGPIPGPYGGPPRTGGRPSTGRYCMAPVKADVFIGPPPPSPVVSQNSQVKWLSLPAGSYVTVSFNDEAIVDGPGDDIFIQSFDPRDSANENADIYVSEDGSNFTYLGRVNERGIVKLDLASIGYKKPVKYVKVLGVDQGGCSPGFDLINVRGLPGSVKPPEPEPVKPEPVKPEPVKPETVKPKPTGTISGIKWLDTNGDGKRNSSLVQGDNPDVFFVIDISGSTVKGKFVGETNVGDVNNDSKPDTILDAEIAGFQALNQQLIDKGFSKNARISLIYFADGAATADVKPTTNGVQIATHPVSDDDSSGTPDVEEVLGTFKKRYGDVGVNTNYEAALQEVLKTMSEVGTANGEGNVIFLSDGKSTRGGSFDDEVQELRLRGVNLSAFGVGSGSSLSDLKTIDSSALIFTNLDELLAVFKDLQSPDEAKENAKLEPAIEKVSIYLDLNNNGKLDSKEPVTVTDADGKYSFEGLAAGTYTVREVIPEGYAPTTPPQGSTTVTLTEGGKVTVPFGNKESCTETTKIINIDAQVNNKDNPLLQSFSPGEYQVTVIGSNEGGKYDAWNSSGIERECDAQGENCDLGWETRYYFRSPYNKVVDGNCDNPKYGACRYESSSQAFSNVPEPVLFSLKDTTEMEFYIEDSQPSNNLGGMSLKVVKKCPVSPPKPPEPIDPSPCSSKPSQMIVRLGDVDGFGFRDGAGFKAANKGEANVDGSGVLATGDFLPDINKSGAVATGNGDDFDNRNVKELEGEYITGTGFVDRGTQGSTYTDISLSTSYGKNKSTYRIGANTPGSLIDPNSFFGENRFPGDGNPKTLGDNQPGFVFNFDVSKNTLPKGTPLFFNMVFGDYDVLPASVKVTYVDGKTATKEVVAAAKKGDGAIQATYLQLDFEQVFEEKDADTWHGSLKVDLVAPNEPFTAFDYAEISTKQIAIEECS
ncbi:MAG: VWA domain-containing protein [Microcoleaceae cyanobacterium MO_207.B10]|nr:VWA domain-containing protein [Microcoleaceae cyanobacterium MO_207.B10]